jgi:hypothetical protein
MATNLIDVWDPNSFDPALTAMLAAGADTIRSYMDRDHEIFLKYDRADRLHRSLLRPDNAYAEAFLNLRHHLSSAMKARTIRAWHHTRLTDDEANAFRLHGVEISTPASLKSRLNARVAVGELNQAVSDALFAASPFHSDQFGARSSKFWMTSHPIAIGDSGVKPLMARWGGEVASFWLTDPGHCAALASIGRPSVIELAVPLATTQHFHSAGEAVITTYGRFLG